MAHVPLSLTCFFLVTVVLALGLLTNATRSKAVFVVSVAWLLLQTAISLSGFYTLTSTLPPRFILTIGPALLVALLIVFLPAGGRFIGTIDLERLILFHIVRIFVELTLFWLVVYKQLPRLMTFEGGNLDILIGLSAPLIAWAFHRGFVGRRGLLIWNTLGLIGVLNAVVRALFSAPFRFQHFGFDQPTVAVLYFPFVLLPAFIVPAAIFCHLATFVKMSSRKS